MVEYRSAVPRRILHGIRALIRPDTQIENSPYDGKYLNENGDMTNNAARDKLANRVLQAKSSRMIFGAGGGPSPNALEEIRQFIAHCRAKGVLVLAAFPAFVSHDHPYKEFYACAFRMRYFFALQRAAYGFAWSEAQYLYSALYITMMYVRRTSNWDQRCNTGHKNYGTIRLKGGESNAARRSQHDAAEGDRSLPRSQKQGFGTEVRIVETTSRL